MAAIAKKRNECLDHMHVLKNDLRAAMAPSADADVTEREAAAIMTMLMMNLLESNFDPENLCPCRAAL